MNENVFKQDITFNFMTSFKKVFAFTAITLPNVAVLSYTIKRQKEINISETSLENRRQQHDFLITRLEKTKQHIGYVHLYIRGVIKDPLLWRKLQEDIDSLDYAQSEVLKLKEAI